LQEVQAPARDNRFSEVDLAMEWRKIFVAGMLVGFLCFLIAAPAGAQQTNCDSEASFGRSDGTVFGRYCGVCHTISGKWNRIVKAPLGGLFERRQLVTGQPVTEENVRALIEKGGPSLMPGFQYTLTAQQITEVIQFLKAARCPAESSGSAQPR
jgi:mono/diheme cytochrome c family protein